MAIDQEFYNDLAARRDAGQLGDASDPASDAARFDRLQASGRFQAFTPTTTSTTSTTAPPQAGSPAAAPQPLDPNTLFSREQPVIDVPAGSEAGYNLGENVTTAPAGTRYLDTYRDYATSLADRLGFPPYDPGSKPATLNISPAEEYYRRLGQWLTQLPHALHTEPGRTLTRIGTNLATELGSNVGALAEPSYGRSAGDTASFVTNSILAALLAHRGLQPYLPWWLGGSGGGGGGTPGGTPPVAPGGGGPTGGTPPNPPPGTLGPITPQPYWPPPGPGGSTMIH